MYNEVYKNSKVRKFYNQIYDWAKSLPENVVVKKKNEAENLFKKIGITFSVYNNFDSTERLIPFDMFPRIISSTEWKKIKKGVIQRALAVNAFLNDIYNSSEIIKAKLLPENLIYKNPAYEIKMIGFKVPKRIYSPIIGSDIVRINEKTFKVLEDNCRTPSGVSYMIENREIMMRMFPDLFHTNRVTPIDDYPTRLLQTLMSLAPIKCNSSEPVCVLLTPGPLNSAYYEHSFLSDQMGIEMVESTDLFVEGEFLYMKTVDGPKKVDVVYRRIDDDFLDPLCFNPNSVIGIPGIMDVYRTGGVNICSAPGAGIADDKAIYIYVPEMIKFYLGEQPILENVQTWSCDKDDDLNYVLDNLSDLVVKEVDGSGGYGMLIGPKSSKSSIEEFRRKLAANPRGYIAQPLLDLSFSPTLIKNQVEGRRVDLRPFCLMGENAQLSSGGLTRVAMNEGSFVVNSSQGGGVKDTWVLAE